MDALLNCWWFALQNDFRPVFRRSHALRFANSVFGPDTAITSAVLKGHLHDTPKYAEEGSVILRQSELKGKSRFDVGFVARKTHLTLDFDLRFDTRPADLEAAMKDVFAVRVNGIPAQRMLRPMTQTMQRTGDLHNARAKTTRSAQALLVSFRLSVPMIADAQNTLSLSLRDQGYSLLVKPSAVRFDASEPRNSFPDDQPPTGRIDIWAINGVEVTLGDSVALPFGAQVIMLRDGRLRCVDNEPLEKIYFRSSLTNDLGEVGLSLPDLSKSER